MTNANYSIRVEPVSVPEMEGVAGPRHPIPTDLERKLFGVATRDGKDRAIRLYLDAAQGWRQPVSPLSPYPAIGDRGQVGTYWQTVAASPAQFAYDGTIFNGKPGFIGQATTTGIRARNTDSELTTLTGAEWTLMMLIKLTGPTNAANVLASLSGQTTLGYLIYFGSSSNSLSTAVGGDNSNMTGTGIDRSDPAILVAVAYSSTRGTELRYKGKTLIRDNSRVAPLPAHAGIMLGSPSAANAFNGIASKACLFDVDMTSPEYLNTLESIERDIMAMNGITP